MATPAQVSLPIRHALGSGEGRTRSAVSDIARKSPAIMTMIISSGERIACPVIRTPTARNSTVTIFLVIELSV